MVNNFFSKQDFNWKRNVGSLCTDGASAVLGKTSGFATLVKKEAPHIIVTHCFLHNEKLICILTRLLDYLRKLEHHAG